MTEEDVKALHALNKDVESAVRWLSDGSGTSAMRMINAAMLLTRAGLHIEKMIGDAEEAEFLKGLASSPAHDPDMEIPEFLKAAAASAESAWKDSFRRSIGRVVGSVA